MRNGISHLAPLLLLLLVGCGDDRESVGTTGDASIIDRAQARSLHTQLLDRQPGVADLPEDLLGVANACRLDKSHPVCTWGHETLGREDWERIRAAWEEEDRRAAEQELMLEACREGDEAALESMYPGRFAFYQMVRSPPAYVETPVDAVVAIGISSAPRGKALRVVKDGMASEGLQVQYGGPRLRDYSPNEFAARSNTETFFYGYYTPEIESRMDRSRPECDRLRSTPFIQAACRRDVAVSIVSDWMESREHRSVRFIVSGQSSWPEYELLLAEYLGDREAAVDTGSFGNTLRRDSSFLLEICAPGPGPELWLDYEFYVRRLFPDY
jgi:hypothetical protein